MDGYVRLDRMKKLSDGCLFSTALRTSSYNTSNSWIPLLNRIIIILSPTQPWMIKNPRITRDYCITNVLCIIIIIYIFTSY